MPELHVGQYVHWNTCPPAIAMFAHNRIKAIDGEVAQLYFIRGWVRLADLKLVTVPSDRELSFWQQYDAADF